MYYFNKIVGWALSPFGILFLGLCLGWLFRKFSLRKTGLTFTTLALVFTWLLGCGVTTRLIGPALEGDEITQTASEPVDAIIVLGGGAGEHKHCNRAELYSGADRIWEAARQYRRYAAQYPTAPLPVFCTGSGTELSTRPFLVDFGIPKESITCLEEPRNTEEESKAIRSLLSSSSPRIALVTSAWHMPRAETLFIRVGFEVVPCPTDYEMHAAAERPLEIGDFFPSAEAFQRNSYALKEWVARFGYWALRR